MKILVSVKRVADYKAVIRLKPDGSGVDTSQTKMTMNPFDEIAVEEAVRMKEKKIATEIVAVSMGGDACQETLRTALAMGADRAILLKTDAAIEPLTAAKLLAHIVENEKPSLVILGKQAIDTDNNQVGQMLAALLRWPQGTFASKIEMREGGVSVTREIDGGLETLFLALPAVITTDLRLNEPRYLSLPNIVQAKKKTITITPVESLPVKVEARVKMLKAAIPEKRRNNIKVESAAELVKRLKTEAQVL